MVSVHDGRTELQLSTNHGEEIIRIISARKASESESRRFLGKPLNKWQRSDLARLKNIPDSEIDYSDIPPLTEEQLATPFRPNKHLVAVRLDREVRSVMEHQRSGH
jgi:hypothetical protein